MLIKRFFSLCRQTSIPAFAGMALLLATPAHSAEQRNTFLPESELQKHGETLHRVEEYLSKLTTIVSDFTQVAPDGSLASGKFFLERPGKMRWQYNPPTPILIIADGKQLVFYDMELQQVSYFPMDSTLIAFLAEPVIRFNGNVGITAVEETHNVIRVTLAQRDKPSEGSLMLELSDRPLLIRNMVVTDATNQVTTVSLNDAKFGTRLDKKLFIFRDPRKPRLKT